MTDPIRSAPDPRATPFDRAMAMLKFSHESYGNAALSGMEAGEIIKGVASLRGEVERLKANVTRLTSNPTDFRYWEGRYRDEAARVSVLEGALSATLEWIDAVPKETLLPAMPGFDRDEVDGLLANSLPVNAGNPATAVSRAEIQRDRAIERAENSERLLREIRQTFASGDGSVAAHGYDLEVIRLIDGLLDQPPVNAGNTSSDGGERQSPLAEAIEKARGKQTPPRVPVRFGPSDPIPPSGGTNSAPVERDIERFSKLADEPLAEMPNGHRAKLDERSTAELIAETSRLPRKPSSAEREATKIRHPRECRVFIQRQLQRDGSHLWICHTGIAPYLPGLFATQADAIKAVDEKLLISKTKAPSIAERVDREAIARKLAHCEWPLATEEERMRWCGSHWRKWLPQADTILSLLSKTSTSPDCSGLTNDKAASSVDASGGR